MLCFRAGLLTKKEILPRKRGLMLTRWQPVKVAIMLWAGGKMAFQLFGRKITVSADPVSALVLGPV